MNTQEAIQKIKQDNIKDYCLFLADEIDFTASQIAEISKNGDCAGAIPSTFKGTEYIYLGQKLATLTQIHSLLMQCKNS